MSNHTGAMVAFFLPAQAAAELYEAYKTQFDQPCFDITPQEELHLTLAYLGDTADGTIDNQTRDIVLEAVREYSKNAGIISGKVSPQTGKFENSDYNVCWAGFNSPVLAAFRQGLVEALAAKGGTVASDYGFTPHITLCYGPTNEQTPTLDLPDLSITFDTITVAWGDERFNFPLHQEEPTLSNQEITAIEKSEGSGKTLLRAYGNIERAAAGGGIDTSKRRITFCAYPYVLDRHGTTIRPSAFQLDNYKKNPISSFAHDNNDELPVAKGVEVWVEQVGNPNGRQAGLWCVLEFATHAFAEDLYQCYVGGFMNAVSIEAEALDYELPGRDFDGQTGPTYTKVELVDISCVPVPGNQGALALRAKPDGSSIERAWYRVWEKVSRAGREMSNKNMAALKGLHDKLAEMEDQCKTIREALKAFLDEKQTQASNVEKAAPETDETIKRDASASLPEKQQPSDAATANPTREADVVTDQDQEATTPHTDQTEATSGNCIDSWLVKLGWNR